MPMEIRSNLMRKGGITSLKLLMEIIISSSTEQTQELGAKLGRLSQPRDVILLVGNLGAGKTCLTQGIATGLAIDEYAVSPSFTIMRQYRGVLPLYHFDFYRLDSVDDIYDLGMDDYLYGDGLCVIEWAEKGMELMPDERLLIEMEYVSENERRLTIQANGERYIRMLNELKA